MSSTSLRVSGLALAAAASLLSARLAGGMGRSGRLPRTEEGFRAKGPASAPVLVVEYSDFECPACRMAEGTIRRIERVYGDNIRFVFVNDPLRMHRWAFRAAVAAECAGRLGKFWPYHDLLYGYQDEWAFSSDPGPYFSRYAARVGLKAKSFDECLRDPAAARSVRSDMERASREWVGATPTFFVNGRRFVGGLQLASQGTRWIDAVLKKKGAGT